MASTENKGLEIPGNETVNDPKPNNPSSIGQGLDLNLNLNLGIVNQFGQLMGEYSWLDEDLWLPKSGDDDDDDEQQLELCNDGVKCDFYQSQKNIVVIDQPSEYAYNSIFNGGMESVKEKSSSLRDSSQKQTQSSSPVSVLHTKRSYSNIRTATCSEQATEPDLSKGLQFLATAVSTIEQNQVVHSDSDYSVESSLSDESEEYVPSKQVRTRKISDLLESNNNSNQEIKKCMHCEATQTPQWRTGPMGPKTLCNACGVQFKHGRLFDDYRPLRSPTFNPSLHFNLPKKVQEIRMGYTSERVLNPTPKRHKPKKVKEVRGSNNTYTRDPNYTHKSKRVENMRMGSTCERDPKDLTPEFKTVELRKDNKIDLGQTSTSESERIEEMVLDNKNDLIKLTSEANIVKERSSINNGEMEQSRAHRAKNFQGLREKASALLESASEWTMKRNLVPKAMKKCSHCESTKTPQWREGPNGRHTLCNACGVQYRHGKLFPEYRPLKSPTYDPLLHSHLPKRVMEIRKRNAEICATSDNCEELV